MPPTSPAPLRRLARSNLVPSSTIITQPRPTLRLPSLPHHRPASSTSTSTNRTPSGGAPLARPDPDTTHAATLINPTPQVDQTRTDPTDPSSAQKPQQIGEPKSRNGGDATKQPDPQAPGSRSTGIEREGPQERSGKATEGEVKVQKGSGPFMRQE